MSITLRHRTLPAVVMLILLLPISAFAHHPMGGDTPETFMNGLLSGLGHPLIELDHFAFLIAAAVLAAYCRHALSLVACFIGASILAVVAGGRGIGVPGLELLIFASLFGIALTLLVSNVATSTRHARITSRRKPSTSSVLFYVLFVVAGAAHGLAYSAAIAGAENTPFVAYLAGLFAIQFIVSAIVISITRSMQQAMQNPWLPAKLVGATTLGIAITLAFQTLEGSFFPS